MENLLASNIGSKIYILRGHKVMLDSDLAFFYGVETKVLNQSVQRNIERFPDDFMFQLTEIEWNFLKSQFVTSKTDPRGGKQKLPLVFTEYGVAMLSSILRSPQAIQVNIAIMRTFGMLREQVPNHILAQKIDDLEYRYEGRFKVVFDAIRELMTKTQEETPRKKIKGLDPNV